MAVVYEWDIETVTTVESEDHEEGECLEHDHCASYAELVAQLKRHPSPGDGLAYSVVLVRDDDAGRSWAYMKDGKLPEHFEDAYQCVVSKVPQRFHQEVARA